MKPTRKEIFFVTIIVLLGFLFGFIGVSHSGLLIAIIGTLFMMLSNFYKLQKRLDKIEKDIKKSIRR